MFVRGFCGTSDTAVRVLFLVAFLSAISSLGGCAAHEAPHAAATPRLPWWIASPSAPLPKGFPEPGPPGEIVVKQYPAYRAAVVKSGPDAKTTNGMFFPLFRHIEKNNVAMSSPVEIAYDGARGGNAKHAPQSMAFIYSDPAIGKSGGDGLVEVIDVPAMTMASVGISGSYTDAQFEKAYKRLAAWLAEHREQYEAAGKPRYLAYNSPFVLPFMRYGEVQLPVRALRMPELQGK